MSSLQTVLTNEQRERLRQELDNNTYTFLDDLVKTHTPSSIIDSILQNNLFSHKLVSHLTHIVPLGWFRDVFSVGRYRNLIYWSILFVYSFRYNKNLNHPLFQKLCRLLELGNDRFWMYDEFDSITRAELFWNTVIHTGDKSLIMSSVHYLSKYKQEHSDWYTYMIESFIDISTNTPYISDDYLTLAKSPIFRKWLKKVPELISDYFRRSLKYTCELQEAQDLIDQSRQIFIELVLDPKVPTDVIKYVISKYL